MAGLACALELLGWLAARAGSHQRAAWLLGAAETRWERAGRRFAGLPFFEQARAGAVARSAAALGAERFAELLARGARQPLAATIAFALDETRDPDDDGDGDAPAALAGRLTAREQEIAVLVADGLTNRQVAEKLFISRRTVDAHLEHIFGKLGITSRVMLAIHAREQIAEAAAASSAEFSRVGGQRARHRPGTGGSQCPRAAPGQFPVATRYAASCPR